MTAEAAIVTSQGYFDYASSTAVSYGIDPERFTETLQCESNFDPEAIGDKGTSLGIAQIHLPAHPEVSREKALDGIWSINWAAKQFSAGRAAMWTCWRILEASATAK